MRQRQDLTPKKKKNRRRKPFQARDGTGEGKRRRRRLPGEQYRASAGMMIGSFDVCVLVCRIECLTESRRLVSKEV